MTVLAIIGLVVGLVVLLVVIKLLNDTLTPLRSILADVQNAKTAPMLERGVPGTDQLGQTRRLAESVPPLALAYLAKLGASPAPPPPAYAPPPPAYAAAGRRRRRAEASSRWHAPVSTGLEEVQLTMSTITMVSRTVGEPERVGHHARRRSRDPARRHRPARDAAPHGGQAQRRPLGNLGQRQEGRQEHRHELSAEEHAPGGRRARRGAQKPWVARGTTDERDSGHCNAGRGPAAGPRARRLPAGDHRDAHEDRLDRPG